MLWLPTKSMTVRRSWSSPARRRPRPSYWRKMTGDSVGRSMTTRSSDGRSMPSLNMSTEHTASIAPAARSSSAGPGSSASGCAHVVDRGDQLGALLRARLEPRHDVPPPDDQRMALRHGKPIPQPEHELALEEHARAVERAERAAGHETCLAAHHAPRQPSASLAAAFCARTCLSRQAGVGPLPYATGLDDRDVVREGSHLHRVQSALDEGDNRRRAHVGGWTYEHDSGRPSGRSGQGEITIT